MVQNIYQGQCDIPNDYTVIDVCTLVKRFLRDLKPPLLDSDEFRQRLFKKACQARISNCFVLTRDEMADMFYTDDRTKERQAALLSDIHFSTLGYVMRQLNIISAHCESHKMSIENLTVVAYNQSKLANVMHARGLTAQLRKDGAEHVIANSLHPGGVDTPLMRNTIIYLPGLKQITAPFRWFSLKTSRDGAQTSLHVALSKKLGGISGKYFSDCKLAKENPLALDDQACQDLYNYSLETTGLAK